MVGGRDSCFSLLVRTFPCFNHSRPFLFLTLPFLTLPFSGSLYPSGPPAVPLSMLLSSPLPPLGNVASLTTQNKLLPLLCSRPLGPAWQCWA